MCVTLTQDLLMKLSALGSHTEAACSSKHHAVLLHEPDFMNFIVRHVLDT